MQEKPEDMCSFELIRIQPTIILMRHKDTRKVYRYVESLASANIRLSQPCPDLIYPLQFHAGFLFQTGLMTLSSQIQSLLRTQRNSNFQQQQIINTIEPVVRALGFIHREGQLHGALSPDNIIIDQFGDLKLYYPGIYQSAKFYYQNPSGKLEDDYRALGIMILELLGFQKPIQSEENKILRTLVESQRYTQKFLFCLLCMLRRSVKFIPRAIIQFLKTDTHSFDQKLSEQEKQFFESGLMLERQKKSEQVGTQAKRGGEKVEFTPPLIKHADQTPKKLVPTAKKYMKVEDVENRRNLQESKKKKPSDHVLKRVSNGKTEGENAPSPSYKRILRDIRQTKQRQDLLKMAVTVKRMRTVSKKKIG